MSSIATETFTSFGIDMAAGISRAQVETFVREGVDGAGRHTLAKRPRSVEGPTRKDVADETAAQVTLAAYAALVGTSVTVVDQHGTSWTNVTVEDCTPTRAALLSGYRVTAQWRLLVT